MTGTMKLSKVMKWHGSILSILMGYLCIPPSGTTSFTNPSMYHTASSPHIRQHYEMSRIKEAHMDVWHFSQISYLTHIHFRI